MKPIIFCDFDGTITLDDTTDAILEKFADPAWREAEERWVAGKIGSRECLREQMSLIRASEEDLGRLVDAIPIDPHFPEFAEECVGRGFPFHILSDGFDWVIQRTLSRPELQANGLSRKFRVASSHLQVQERFMITTFPHGSVHCTHGCATCKPQWVECEGRGYSPLIFIGDGNSDRHAASCADIVFARKGKSLMQHCEEENIPCHSFESFKEIQDELHRELMALASRTAAPPSPFILTYETES